MAKKRERKPIQPVVAEPFDQLFEGIEGNPLDRPAPISLPEVEGTLDEAVSDLLGLQSERPLVETTSHGVAVAQNADPPDAASVDDYIHRQVLMEMYGTEHPSEHDIITRAIKNYL